MSRKNAIIGPVASAAGLFFIALLAVIICICIYNAAKYYI